MLGKIDNSQKHVFSRDKLLTFGDIDIESFGVSHDAIDPQFYRFMKDGKSFVMLTDTGYVSDRMAGIIENADGYLIESNHDIRMLETGPYPYYLKRRVMGDKGHLSNELSGRLLCDILHDNLKHILLGHLSKENNYAKLAYETVKLEVTLSDNIYKGEDLDMAVARRDMISEIITV